MKTIITIMLISLTFGCTKKAKLTKEQSQYIGGLRGKVDSSFCEDTTFFRVCFTTTKKECVKFVQSKFNSCMPEKVPEVINAETGADYGRELGSCIGTKYETHFKGQGKMLDKTDPACGKMMEGLGF